MLKTNVKKLTDEELDNVELKPMMYGKTLVYYATDAEFLGEGVLDSYHYAKKGDLV